MRQSCQSRKCQKKLFAFSETKPIEVAGTFESELYCEESGEMCVDESTAVEGHGKALLGKKTTEKLNVLGLDHQTRHRHTQPQVKETLKTFSGSLLCVYRSG